MTVAEALAFFDAAAPVSIDEMIGEWRGAGLHTAHPMDGLLERYGWYGKVFIDAETVHPLLQTSRPRARLRLLAHRGVVSATMVYDHLPINDVFRRVDASTLIGLMDMRGMGPPFFFVLRAKQ